MKFIIFEGCDGRVLINTDNITSAFAYEETGLSSWHLKVMVSGQAEITRYLGPLRESQQEAENDFSGLVEKIQISA